MSETNDLEKINDLDFINFIMINDSNIKYPCECSDEELRILEFQDHVIKYQELLDKYRTYTHVLSVGYSKFKTLSNFARSIIL